MLKRVWEVGSNKELRNILIKYLGDYVFIVEPKGLDSNTGAYMEMGETCDGVKYGVQAVTNLSNIPEIKNMEYQIESNILGVRVQFDCDKIRLIDSIMGLFSGFKAKGLIFRGLDTSLVTNMNGMFAYVKADIYGLESLDTRSVISMDSMFEQCRSNILSISNFDTSRVVSMKSIFRDCEMHDINISKWDVSKVVTMEYMFSGCKVNAIQIRNWRTESLSDISYMFANCNINEPVDLRGIDVNTVRRKHSLFTGSKAKFIKSMV